MTILYHGASPYHLAVIHGGPGAPGSAAALAAGLSGCGGVLEPWQSADSVAGEIEELRRQLAEAEPPLILVGHSWGAWLAALTAAAHPGLADKLILIGCGALKASYAEEIAPRRLANLSPEEGGRYRELLKLLEGGDACPDRDARLAELGQLTEKSDSFATLAASRLHVRPVAGRIYQQVWREAAARRASGELLDAFRQLTCPVTVFHGENDPSPAAGVLEPLREIGLEFIPYLLPQCGHSPWKETYARNDFFRKLKWEVMPYL